MARQVMQDTDAFSLKRLLSAVVAGNEEIGKLAEKLAPLVYDDIKQYEDDLWNEQRKYELNKAFEPFQGIKVISFGTPVDISHVGYQAFCSIVYPTSESFILFSSQVQAIIQNLATDLGKSINIRQRIESETLSPGVTVAVERQEAVAAFAQLDFNNTEEEIT